MNTIHNNLDQVRQSICQFERKYARPAASTQLLAVSKTWPATAIQEAYDAGQRAFGENYVDEAVDKIQALANLQCEWHFIGHLQSNKSRAVAEHFDWVHTLDREKIARRLATQRPAHLPPLQCCIQVNIDAEESKSGVLPEQTAALLDAIAPLENLQVRGLMVIPAIRSSLEAQRDVFRQTATLLASLKTTHPQLDTLSMGMSADMEAAVAEGSSIVRIGTAIFGQRPRAGDTVSHAR